MGPRLGPPTSHGPSSNRGFPGSNGDSTVTQTAQRLNVTPGAVSLQLQSLAHELRTDLFARIGRRIVPTPQAHRFAEHVREVMKKFARSSRISRTTPPRTSGRFISLAARLR